MGRRELSIILCGLLIIISLLFYGGINSVAAKSRNEFNLEATQVTDLDNNLNLPLIFSPFESTEIPPPAGSLPKILFCKNPSLPIPDNNSAGVSDALIINDAGFIGDIDIRLDIDHSWVGDLIVTLVHEETGTALELLNRPGYPQNDQGCSQNGIKTILDDEITLPVDSECASSPAAVSGIFTPEQSLNSFYNELIAGTWRLSVSDLIPHDTGKLNQWCIAVEIHDTPVTTPAPPSPKPLPDRALISGVTGRNQALPLDCESRSAVDWANYYGTKIDELKFFNSLPVSDNPDLGFVGNVRGEWGQIPPNPYGVNAEPVAKRLRHYGLPAVAQRPFTWENLKAEIAGGRPVIAWIIGSVNNGVPEYYPPKEGNLTIVARYEHTVVVTGYSPDSVTYLNGGTIYQKSLKQFLESWSVLGNMAITMGPE